MESKSKAKKVFGVIKTVLVWIILVVSVFMMLFTIISTSTFNKTDKSIFGYKFMIVLSESMSATHFDAGDVIISKEVDKKDLKVGDVITFVSQNPDSYGQTITHMIKEVTTDANGDIAFVTYGTTKGIDNEDQALATMIVGKYQGKIPKLGYFFNFMKTVPGYIVCILIPFLLLIISQAINCVRLFRRYRAEQMEGLEAERKKIEDEREENRKMMEELLALKAQMAAGGAVAQPAETPVADVPATEETATETPVEEAQATETVAAEETVTEEPVAEETVVETVASEEPVTEAAVQETTVADQGAPEAPTEDAPVEPDEACEGENKEEI